MICPQCGYENINGKIYCQMCGEQLDHKKEITQDIVALKTAFIQNFNIKNPILKKFHDYLDNLSIFKFIVAMTLLTFLILIPLIPLLFFMYPSLGFLKETDQIKEFAYESNMVIAFSVIFIVIIGPITETLIFQFGIIKLLRLLPVLHKKNFIPIMISAFAFGLAHNYGPIYIIITFLVGLLLAYSFLLYEIKRTHPFWVVTAIHMLRNSISVIAILLDVKN